MAPMNKSGTNMPHDDYEEGTYDYEEETYTLPEIEKKKNKKKKSQQQQQQQTPERPYEWNKDVSIGRDYVDSRPLSGLDSVIGGNPEEIRVWLHRATVARGCRVKKYCRLCETGEEEGKEVVVSRHIKCLLHDHYIKVGIECLLGDECPMGCK